MRRTVLLLALQLTFLSPARAQNIHVSATPSGTAALTAAAGAAIQGHGLQGPMGPIALDGLGLGGTLKGVVSPAPLVPVSNPTLASPAKAVPSAGAVTVAAAAARSESAAAPAVQKTPASRESALDQLRQQLDLLKPHEKSEAETAAGLRSEISQAARDYAANKNRISPLRGMEPASLDARRAAKGHVVSLGSGPDVFRPLVDFPLAKHFHLVDVLTGWGVGPGEVVYEFLERLRSLAPGAKLEILSQGFSKHVPPEMIAAPQDRRVEQPLPSSFWESWEDRRALHREPLAVRVSWESPSAGRQVRNFYLHPLDYNGPDHVAELLTFLPPASRLAGMLLTGAPMLAEPGRSSLLARLARDAGVFVLEAYLDFPDFSEAIPLLKKDYTLTKLPPDPAEEDFGHRPTTFLLEGRPKPEANP